ncbi:hypothetical protein HMPREF3201_02387 [Megasphaera sp. MJR8396C]|nr:hypothetical protein HMPREF3201_02387 [Megasphaera sp. MJR8396C]
MRGNFIGRAVRIVSGQTQDFPQASVMMSQEFINAAGNSSIPFPVSWQGQADGKFLHFLQTFQVPPQGMLHMIPDLDVGRNIEENMVTRKEKAFTGHIEAAQARCMARRMDDREFTICQVQDVPIADGLNREVRIRRKGPGLVGKLAFNFFRRHPFTHEIIFGRLPGRAVFRVDEVLIVDGVHVNRAAFFGKQADKARVIGMEMGQKEGRVSELDAQFFQTTAQGILTFRTIEARIDDQILGLALDDIGI